MMLLTRARSPASCAAMLPQKFSAATTSNLPWALPAETGEEPAAGDPAPPQPARPPAITSDASSATPPRADLDTAHALHLKTRVPTPPLWPRNSRPELRTVAQDKIGSYKRLHLILPV